MAGKDNQNHGKTSRKTAAWYKDIVDHARDLIQCIDSEGRYIYVNQAWLTTLNYTAEDIDNLTLWDIIHPDSAEHFRPVFEQVLTGKEFDEIETVFKTKGGAPVMVEGNAAARFDENGRFVYMHSIFRNATDQKQAEESLRASEEKYREILATIEEGYYEVDLDGNFLFFNDSLCEMSGYSRDELRQVDYEELYRNNTKEVFNTYLRVYKTGESEKMVDWPLVTKGGREIFVEISITLRRDITGDPIGFRGMVRDITERKQAEEALAEHLAFEKMLARISTKFVNLPPEQIDTGINEALKNIGEFFDVDRSYLYHFNEDGKTYSNTHLWCKDGVEGYYEKDQNVPVKVNSCWEGELLKGNTVIINDIETMLPGQEADKQDFQFEEIQSLLTIPLTWGGKVFGCFGLDHVNKKHSWTEEQVNLLQVAAELIVGAIARHDTDQRIRILSFHDQLTGLYNRYFLGEEMERLNTKRQMPLTVIMADVNSLKLVNDTYGHNRGDELLKTAADIIRNSCRKEDIIARWGGDEFVVLLPQTAADEARLICKRIAEGCKGAFVEDVPVSIALGIATKVSETINISETLQEAEKEMYREKLTESRSIKSKVITSLLKTLTEKSFETDEHTRGMQRIAKIIGAKLNLPDSEMQRLELLITLHDIGKIKIPEAILTKSSSLTDDEWETIRKHPEIGCRIAMATEQFAHVADDILAHHERWDSSGYPKGLKGKSIPLLARITAIADAYEVMSHGRPYKKAMSNNEIFAEFKRCSGTQFDPELVEIFLLILEADG